MKKIGLLLPWASEEMGIRGVRICLLRIESVYQGSATEQSSLWKASNVSTTNPGTIRYVNRSIDRWQLGEIKWRKGSV